MQKNNRGFIQFLPIIVAGVILGVSLLTMKYFLPKTETMNQPNQLEIGLAVYSVSQGGTGIGSYTPGDMLFASAPYTLSKLASSSGYSILNINPTTGRPAWTQTLGSLGSPLTSITATNIYASSTYFGALGVAPLLVSTSSLVLPDIVGKGDTDTGLGWNTANQMALYTGGTARLTIDNSGNVGIGTTGPGALLEIINTDTSKKSLLINATSNDGNDALYIGQSGTGRGLQVFRATALPTRPLVTLNENGGTSLQDTLYIYNVGLGNGLHINSNDLSHFVINSSGNVGIGTTTPSNLLSVYSSSAATAGFSGGAGKGVWSLGYDVSNNYFAIASSSSITSNVRMVIDNNGNVGIGTTSPGGLLAIEQGTETNSFVVSNTGSSTPSLVVTGVNGDGRVGIGIATPLAKLETQDSISSASSYGIVKVTNSYNNYDVNPTVSYPVVSFIRAGKVGSTFDSQMQIGISRYEDVGTAGRTQADFLLVNGSAGYPDTTVMSLRSNGNVGIGTTGPGSQLHVENSAAGDVTASSRLSNGANYIQSYVLGQSYSTNSGLFDIPISSNGGYPAIYAGGTGTARDFYLGTYYNAGVKIGTNNLVRMTIKNDGNVGIGTTTPTTQLQVTASATNATSTLTVGKPSQNKGSCLELFDAAGTPVYAFVAAGASTFTLSATSCK